MLKFNLKTTVPFSSKSSGSSNDNPEISKILFPGVGNANLLFCNSFKALSDTWYCLNNTVRKAASSSLACRLRRAAA